MGSSVAERSALAEITIIVVGILLALGVDAGWGWLQDRQAEREYLTALAAELSLVPPSLDRTDSILALEARAVVALLGQFGASDRAPADSLMRLVSSAARVASFSASRGVLDDLLASGSAQLIRNDSIRMSVGQYDDLLQSAAQTAASSRAISNERLRPLLEGHVSRAEELRIGPYNAQREVPFPPSSFPPDFNTLFANPAFESILADRWFFIDLQRVDLENIREAVTRIRGLIRAELGTPE